MVGRKKTRINIGKVVLPHFILLPFRELGIGSIEGFADDYSFLIRGLLDLFEAGQDPRWLERAQQLQETQIKLFWDSESGGFFSSTSADPSILLRMKDGECVFFFCLLIP